MRSKVESNFCITISKTTLQNLNIICIRRNFFISKLDYLKRNNRRRKNNVILTKNKQLKIMKDKILKSSMFTYT